MAKILLIHHSGIIGGAGVSLINTVKNIASEHSVTVLISTEPADMLELLQSLSGKYNITVKGYGKRIGALTYYSGGDGALSLRFWYRLLLIFKQRASWNRTISEENPDVVIVNSKILSWMSGLREIKKRKSICFVRETIKGREKSYLNKIISKMLDGFDKVIFLSEYDRKREGLNKAKTAVIHNYVDDARLDRSLKREDASENLGLKPNSFHILYVGGVSEMKGFDLAVRAVLCCENDVELIAAGNDFEDALKTKNKRAVDYALRWKKYVDDEDKRGAVHMIGRQQNMSLCYAACDVLVFPMRSPHQSRPAFEAGYFGKPVIITDFENIREFVRDGYNGYLVPADNAEAIYAKIKYLMKNSDVCKSMGENNLRNTDKLHDREKSTAAVGKIIREVLGE